MVPSVALKKVLPKFHTKNMKHQSTILTLTFQGRSHLLLQLDSPYMISY